MTCLVLLEDVIGRVNRFPGLGRCHGKSHMVLLFGCFIVMVQHKLVLHLLRLNLEDGWMMEGWRKTDGRLMEEWWKTDGSLTEGWRKDDGRITEEWRKDDRRMMECPKSRKRSRCLHQSYLGAAIQMLRLRVLELEYKSIFCRNGEPTLSANFSYRSPVS